MQIKYKAVVRELSTFKAGTWVRQVAYKSFQPNPINKMWIHSDIYINKLHGEANRALGQLEAFAQLVPDIDYFIKMHIAKEATTSSKIEGTQTTIEEAVQQEGFIDPERRDDWQEVSNYVEAMNYALARLDELPLSSRLIRATHKILLQGVRGMHKLPGEFRSSQNWIGPSLKSAIFVPPIATEVPALMSDLEFFIHAELEHGISTVPHLIRIAMIHYQFETIHPFLDGNGRVGRLLITLYLMEKRLLSRPALYLSDYFERNRKEYYDRLNAVRFEDDIVGWILFFLRGIIETAHNSIDTFKAILALKEDIAYRVLPKLGKKQVAAGRLIKELFLQPVLDGKQIATLMDAHPSTANRMIDDLVTHGILEELTGYRRNRIYAFKAYLRIFG